MKWYDLLIIGGCWSVLAFIAGFILGGLYYNGM